MGDANAALETALGRRIGGSLDLFSTYALLAGIHEVPAEQVVVLPNSPNVFMAAERAAELSEKLVRVLPTRSQQAGLAVPVPRVHLACAVKRKAAAEPVWPCVVAADRGVEAVAARTAKKIPAARTRTAKGTSHLFR